MWIEYETKLFTLNGENAEKNERTRLECLFKQMLTNKRAVAIFFYIWMIHTQKFNYRKAVYQSELKRVSKFIKWESEALKTVFGKIAKVQRKPQVKAKERN